MLYAKPFAILEFFSAIMAYLAPYVGRVHWGNITGSNKEMIVLIRRIFLALSTFTHSNQPRQSSAFAWQRLHISTVTPIKFFTGTRPFNA